MIKLINSLTILFFTSTVHAQYTQGNPPSDTPVAGRPNMISSITDGEIAKVLLALNDGEISIAEMAKSRTQNSDVAAFADEMISAHQTSIADTNRVISSAAIKTREGNLSKSLRNSAMDAKKELRNTSRAEVDKTYARQQVKMHQQALNTLDASLLPNVQSAALKDHLLRTREAVAMHLEHAKNLNSKIK